MKTIGFVISGKENEGRRALLPRDVQRIKRRQYLHFEQGYGVHLGIEDREYEALGCAVKPKHEVYQCDVICNPKAPERNERSLFHSKQTLFGWLHAVQGRAVTDFLLERRMTGIAWEDMYEEWTALLLAQQRDRRRSGAPARITILREAAARITGRHHRPRQLRPWGLQNIFSTRSPNCQLRPEYRRSTAQRGRQIRRHRERGEVGCVPHRPHPLQRRLEEDAAGSDDHRHKL